MVGIIVLMIVLCSLYVIYWFRHTYYLTRNDIKTYLYLQKKIDKLVEDYYEKNIYWDTTYELGNWYICENKTNNQTKNKQNLFHNILYLKFSVANIQIIIDISK